MEGELSDFLKIAYKYGRVKDLEEAFEEFPVEEDVEAVDACAEKLGECQMSQFMGCHQQRQAQYKG